MMKEETRKKMLEAIAAAEAKTLPGLLECRIARTPHLPAYHQHDQQTKSWETFSWQEIGRQVGRWQKGMRGESLVQGDRVAVLLPNSIQWVCFDQAALALDLVVVPLYTWDSSENIAYILRDSASKLLVVATSELWDPIAPHANTLPALKTVLSCAERTPDTDTPVSFKTISQWLPSETDEIENLAASADQLATIVYTSGTTGPPKGVMLSHQNILWNTEAVLQVVPCYPADVLLSFLPLSHTFERTIGYYAPMMGGSSVAFARSIEDLAEDLRTIRPTIIISVPRIYEKIYSKVRQKMKENNKVSRRLFFLAQEIGWKSFLASQGRGSPLNPLERLLETFLKKTVAAKVLNRLGGRIRLAVSGGAPLQETVSRFFLGLGLPLIQGYGLTEASPVVSTNRLEENIPASVGPPLPDVQCKLGPHDELLIKSPGVMLGYWNLPEKTGEVIDPAGWLHTGDSVEITNNFIYIRGRLKEILVTSTGEKIAPADLEMALTSDPLIEHALVVGEGMPFIAALLVLQPALWQQLARALDLDPQDPSTLETSAARNTVLGKVQELLHAFPAHAQIRAVTLLLDTWSIENGLLTPTLKLKRGEILRRYAGTIKTLYTGHTLA